MTDRPTRPRERRPFPATAARAQLRLRPSSLLLAVSLLGIVAGAPALGQGGLEAQDEKSFDPALFQLYDTQAARAIAKEAREHLEAERWSEAIESLQSLIEEHDGEVLGGEKPKAEGAEHPSQTPVHAGAGAWAVARLFALPPDARAVYRQRFGARASGALVRALETADRGALSRLAQRWPLTDAAESAWWALGDLEMELGHSGDALRAWARAAGFELGEARIVIETEDEWRALRARLAEGAAPARRAGALARVDFALGVLESVRAERTSRPEQEASYVRGPATSIAAAALSAEPSSVRRRARPMDDDSAASWPAPFELPLGPFRYRDGASRLFPQRFGDTVLVNTSRSVHALDAFDGTERWRLDSSQLGWDQIQGKLYQDFEEAIDTRESLVTAAVSRGVVVAPVQIPLQLQNSQAFNELSIIEIIPERRLVALDVETGEPLWNTFPPVDWDGDSGSFGERMSVVGPPTIVGARVLVPVARLRGRIELYLGCFDLGTGDVLWSAPIVTGQRELNMFGRATVEFSAPPPVVSGDTVLMLTQLGLVAAVDLFTGEVLWDTVYEQVKIHAPQFYTPGYIDNAWRNAPPIVVGETVVAAPQDGRDLIGLDLRTGSVMWTIDHTSIARVAGVPGPGGGRRMRSAGLMALIGADEEHVIIGGHHVFSMELVRGVRGGPPYRMDWVWPQSGQVSPESGLPAVDAGSVFVPDGSSLVRLERRTGREVENVAGSIGSGQILVSNEMLFAVNGRAVHARFDWLAMVERARRAAEAPNATVEDALTLAKLLLERAENAIAQGQGPGSAVELAREAAEVAERFGARRTVSDGELASESTATRAALLRALLVETRAERLRGKVERAIEVVGDAVRLAEGGPRELEPLLVAYTIERDRAPLAERLARLARIAEVGRDETIRIDAARPAQPWVAPDLYRAVIEATRGGTVRAADPWMDPWVGALTPSVASLVAGDGRAARFEETVPVGVFVALERVRLGRESATADAGLALELDALHDLAAREETVVFETTLSLYASSRIESLRLLHPGAPAFDAIEALADASLARALDETERTGSIAALDRVQGRFPGSAAARRAETLRVEYALTEGTPETIAEIVIESLPPDWSPRKADERDIERLSRLASAMGRGGNRAMEIGLLRNLARYSPDVLVPLGTDDERIPVGEALVRARASERAPVAGLPTFDAGVVHRAGLRGNFVGVARVLIDEAGAQRELGIFASPGRLLAIPTRAGGVARWEIPAEVDLGANERQNRVLPFERTLVVGETDRIVSLDAATGTERWSFGRRKRRVIEVTLAEGVVVVTLDGDDPRDDSNVYGIDAALGIELWRLGPIDDRYASRVVAGDGLVAFLPLDDGDTELHDLYTGHLVALAKTGNVGRRNSTLAWIADERLVVPRHSASSIRQQGNTIDAFSVADGRRIWSIDLDRALPQRHNLVGVVEMPVERGSAERRRTVMLETAEERRLNPRLARTFDLFVLDEARGAIDTASRLRVGERSALVGVRDGVLARLESPTLVVLTQTPGRNDVDIHAVDSSLKTMFHVAAPRKIGTSGSDRFAPPVLGDGALALLVREMFGRAPDLTSEVRLMFLDPATGEHLETRPLQGVGLGALNRVEDWSALFPFGGTLVASGPHAMDLME